MALLIEAGFGSKMVFVSSLRLAWMRQQQDAGKLNEGQLTLNNLGRGFRAIAKRAGIKDISVHDLRRSAITHLVRKLSSHVVQRLAGHSSITTTLKYYLSAQPDELMQAKAAVALTQLSDARRTETA